MKMSPLKSLNGRKIAIDASMAIYQFLIAVRQGGEGNVHQQLTNEAGETTSHIQVRNRRHDEEKTRIRQGYDKDEHRRKKEGDVTITELLDYDILTADRT